MILPDVNVLIQAYRRDAPDHEACARWLRRVLDSDESVGLADVVLSGFIRVVTNPRIFEEPAPVGGVLDFARVIRGRPNAILVTPGERHWEIFDRLCREVSAQGKLVPDAYLAALALEWRADVITFDRDFECFRGLRWRPP